ncbi:hypothetical protein [Aquicella lusitana]|uniref:Ion channel n=1 Tax=Aquicella lusitana TaxID=254246 RepID=A0A370GB96_9COXI|nr:hypothetical protein [Aquicella lusitana]RDI40977.1 hypothetical protein C8D86_12221 [Aquicella lusitana]VVC73618.1 hypothetical protein AQULUS_13650 [Aquicella lusitana]
MFEKHDEPLASTSRFVMRLVYSFFFGLFVIIIVLCIGVWGYHIYGEMSWVEAFLNASMVFSDMGQATPLRTQAGMLFGAFYALFCGIAYVSVVGVIFAPIIHRFLHRFHSNSD